MKNPNRIARPLRVAAVCILTLCLAAGMVPALENVYGAAAFSYNTPFSNTGRTTYTHNGAFSGQIIVNGVDVSAYQSTNSNWNTAKANGVDFAIMRVTWTGYRKDTHSYKNKDSSFATNYKNAKAAGLMVGVYVFSQAKTETEARNEANYAISRLKELGIGPNDLDLPIYMDYEFAGGKNGRLYNALNKTLATKCAAAFCSTIRSAGYTPGIYASKSFYDSYINVSSLGSDVDIWCAQYWYQCAYSGRFSKWQYSSTANIPGILSSSTGKVGSTDVNFWYINRSPNNMAVTDIYGSTEFNYTGKIIKPKFEVYNGSTLLKEGTDYTIAGINNIKKGTNTAYAYIRGIGSYKGYAIVPFTIGSGYITHIGLNGCKDSNGNYVVCNASELPAGTGKTALAAGVADEDAEAAAAAAEIENAEEAITEDETAQPAEAAGEEVVTEESAEGNEAALAAVPEETAAEETAVEETAAEETVAEETEEQTEEAAAEEQPADTDAGNAFAGMEEDEEIASEEIVTEETEGADEAALAAASEDEAAAVEGTGEQTEEAAAEEQPADTDAGNAFVEENAEQAAPADGETAQPEESTQPEENAQSGETDEEVITMDLEGDSADSAEAGVSYNFKIGSNSYGSYVRNVPEGLTVREFLTALGIRGGYENTYTAAVIDGKGGKIGMDEQVRTGMMLALYKGSTLAGTADIAVNGDRIFAKSGNYISTSATTTTQAASVTVKATYIKKLTRYKKAFKVKVAKKTGVTGYQVRYSRNKNMSGAVVKNISSKNSKVTKKITKLKGGKRYYVQVRSYKTVNGTKYYSAWSKKKSVKTKK